MARVVDYAWGRPSIESLKAAGAVAVCRYLSWLPNGKCLSLSEANYLRSNGIDVVSNWEYYGDWEHDYSGGYDKGRLHATEAARQHLACGGPPGRPIYFSTDYKPPDYQLPTIAAYYKGVASVIGWARTGAYGGYGLIKYLFDANVIRWGWQTYGWSYFRDVPEEDPYLHWDPRAQLRQVKNGVNIGGVDCDLDDSMAADFGQWGTTGGVAVGSADQAFDTPYVKGDEPWVNGQSWMTKAVELPLRGLATSPGRTIGQDVRELWYNVWNGTNGAGGQHYLGRQLDKVDALLTAVTKVAEAVGVAQADLDELQTRPAATLSPEQLKEITDALIAAPDNPLGEADSPAIEAALENVLGRVGLAVRAA